MFEYILCEFEYGYEGQLYQEISNGSVIRLTDLDGNTLTLEGSYGYRVINPTPERPVWAN
jgi:hypothetical protein